MDTRSAMFAGSWYPSRSSECEAVILEFLKEPSIRKEPLGEAVGGIVPHAGWFYSGAIACNVIYALSQTEPADVIVIFGMHLHKDSPSYIMASGAWETPFGPIDIDAELARTLMKQFPFTEETPDHFSPDNTIELQLPFIKYFFKNAKLIPMGIPPRTDALKIGKALVALATEKGRRLMVLGSTDLTHYGDNYGFTPKGTGSKALNWVKTENDPQIIEAILSMDSEQVLSVAENRNNACCAGAVATALTTARAMGATRGRKVAYSTSYDKSPGTSFVGYVGIVFERIS